MSVTIAKTLKHDSAIEGVRQARRAGSMCGWLGACLVIAVGGFAPTYWLQLAPGTFVGSPLVHLHGALFTAWPSLLAAANHVRSPKTGGPPSRLGPLRHLARDGHGVCRLRGRERGPADQAGGGLWRPRTRLSHRVVVDDRALRRLRPGSRRSCRAAGDSQAADGARDDRDPPSSDRASDVCTHRGDGSRPASGLRTAPNGGISDGVSAHCRCPDPRRRDLRHAHARPAASCRISSAARSCSPSRFCACP